jgi:hypothetical protein
MSEEQPIYHLVMPFVTVASRGGPWDDGAYCAGWAMGKLDTRLDVEQPVSVNETIRTVDAPQADLVAMKHGYRMKTKPSELDEWTFAEFTRVSIEGA